MRDAGVGTGETLEKFHRATIHFALAQLEAAEMSLTLTPTDGSRKKFLQNRQDARHRFDQAVRALQAISPRPEDAQIAEKVESLKAKLAELGEEFPASANIAWDQSGGGASRGPLARALQLQRKLQDNLFDFIRGEIELSLTFARTALDSDDPEKRERNDQNANKGYLTARHFLGSDLLTEDQRAQLTAELNPLQESLERLGRPANRSKPKNKLTKKKAKTA